MSVMKMSTKTGCRETAEKLVDSAVGHLLIFDRMGDAWAVTLPW